MSRLDSVIRRLSAQRACLNVAASLVSGVAGPVLEFGLGNGRTYDHLREVLPDRAIFVFDRQIAAHPDCVPDAAYMILGDLPGSLHGVMARLGAPAALAHYDLGSGLAGPDRRLADAVAPALDALMAPGGVVVSDRPMTVARWRPLDPPAEVQAGRYFLYRVEG